MSDSTRLKSPEDFFKDGKKSDMIEETKKELEKEAENPQPNDPHWAFLNDVCEKCGRVYCDHESKY